MNRPRPLEKSGIDYIGPDELRHLLRPREAVTAIIEALRDGLEPGDDPPRTVLDLPDGSGQLLVMPAASASAAGVKVITGAPGNPARGLPRIQGIHLVIEPATLSLVAAVDGAALTALRTPVVSVAAVLTVLERRVRPLNVVVFGAGPQGTGHVATLRDLGHGLATVTYVVRDPSGVDIATRDDIEVVPPAASGTDCAGPTSSSAQRRRRSHAARPSSTPRVRSSSRDPAWRGRTWSSPTPQSVACVRLTAGRRLNPR